MANQEQLDILKQGVEVWNAWRRDNDPLEIDFRESDLSGVDLSEADLGGADFSRANLNEAGFQRAKFWGATFFKSDLSETDLGNADFSGADLREANLQAAYICGANLNGVTLHRANLKNAVIGSTSFGDSDLREIIGLESVGHNASSYIDTKTLRISKGKLPEKFLRGCGLSDMDIEYSKLYNPDLSNEEIVKIQYCIYDLRATQAIQISPLFISYSHMDSVFVDRLEQGLNEKGVRFWRDIHNLTAGKIETQLDRAIRQNPTVLLILSKNSLNSDWVQHEVRKARNLEKELGRDALCPIALDDSWKSSRWPQRIMEQVKEYNILDFSKWEDDATFNEKFAKLLRGLDLFYKKDKE